MEECDAAEPSSEESRQRGHRDLKKINLRVKELKEEAEKSGKTDCNTTCMNVFLEKFSEDFPEDTILLCYDGASRHTSKDMVIPSHIVLFYTPPCTPEMNPVEQIWKEVRKRGFSNRLFSSLEQVVDCLCDSITSLSPGGISSITARDWIVKPFY